MERTKQTLYEIQWDATAAKWHVIRGGTLVKVLFEADTEAECVSWAQRQP